MIPPVLLDPEFRPPWAHVARTLDRRGLHHRGWVALPAGLPTTVRARLEELAPGRSSARLDLAALERGLARHFSDLLSLLAAAGCAPTGGREARDADRDRRDARDEALHDEARARLPGDFDPEGIAITARLVAEGVVPWRMTADDDLEARAAAERDGAELRAITAPVPPTPWDPELATVMTHGIDEERVMGGLLGQV